MTDPWYRRWFTRVAKSHLAATRIQAVGGDAEAQFSLGLGYSLGEGDARDLTQAIYWYREAAMQDHPLAQFNLAIMLGQGQGIAKDPEAEERWFRRAAGGGDAGAQFQLGTKSHRASLSATTEQAREARIEAFKWLQLAANQGYGDSADCLERITLTMSQAEVNEGQRRVVQFLSSPSATGN